MTSVSCPHPLNHKELNRKAGQAVNSLQKIYPIVGKGASILGQVTSHSLEDIMGWCDLMPDVDDL